MRAPRSTCRTAMASPHWLMPASADLPLFPASSKARAGIRVSLHFGLTAAYIFASAGDSRNAPTWLSGSHCARAAVGCRSGRRTGAPRADLAAGGEAVLCAGGAEGRAGGGERLCRKGGGKPQSVLRRSLLPPLLRR